ncbi:hypothetical protein GCM10010909_32620 [Acidocella aquatica]|uniref:HTH tetR-type domain-containing protein n=1 Tax=Acidocella aquatica TaxID=1922313 RepID=A0ABQ6ACP2_9PROT|nr:TetR/AcrR family transcriptional regulator [Acidocella aquatica]GLR68581.1 hypothetical protein GCM10010909_32620 [Acidocella aquatica]
MPAIVDHDERRREVTEAAFRLVAKSGLAALTVRAVADEVGCSTAVVSHYFENKRQLLIQTYELSADRAASRFFAARDSQADLAGCLAVLLPLDAARADDWNVWFCFWGEAVADPELGMRQRARVANTIGFIATLLRRDWPRLRTAGEPLVEHLASRILSALLGVAVQALFSPALWPPARQLQIITDELASLDHHGASL